MKMTTTLSVQPQASPEGSALPLPACGERVGVRGTIDWPKRVDAPPHPASLREVDLFPQAGRGEESEAAP
jgi:hypothetical protein